MTHRDWLKIRKAEVSDVSLILDFIKELAQFEKLAHEVTATEEALQETLFGQHPKAEVLIGEWKDTPVAFALFFYNYSTFLAKPGIYLEDLFVKPDFRGRGLGKQMLCHLAKLASERQCGRLEWSVLNWNQKAIDFYESLGARPMSEWTVYRLDEAGIASLSQSS